MKSKTAPTGKNKKNAQRATRVTVESLRSRIDIIIKEEMNVLFNRVKNDKNFKKWVMRQWFDPEKHANKVWYSPDVNLSNVLDYVSHSKSFPSTPKAMVSQWAIKKSLPGSFALINKDLENVTLDDEEEGDEEDNTPSGKKRKAYSTGEMSYKDIAAQAGGHTHQAVQMSAEKALEKALAIFGGKPVEAQSHEEMENMIEKIYQARIETATEFAQALEKSGGNVQTFFKLLIKKGAVTAGPTKMVDQQEKAAWKKLASRPKEEIYNVLLNDIEQDNNLFKLYQSGVSRTYFQTLAGKR